MRPALLPVLLLPWVIACHRGPADSLVAATSEPTPSISAPAPASVSAPGSVSAPAPASASASSPASASAPAPAPDRVTPELIASLAAYPDALTAEPLDVAAAPEPLFRGRVLWARRFRSRADPSSPFTIVLCDGPCRFTLLDLPTVYGPKDVPLDGARALAIRFIGLFLGGAEGTVTWPSPSRRFEVLVLMDLPPSDVQVTPAARTYFRTRDHAATLESLGRGLDRILWSTPAPGTPAPTPPR